MITLDKPSDSLIQMCVLLMQQERSNWKPGDSREPLEIDTKAVQKLFCSLAGINQCVVINGTYLTAWMIHPQWHNPSEFVVHELLVIKFADGGGTLDDVIEYYRGIGNECGSPVLLGDLLSSRQASYGRALRQAGASPLASAYIL